MRQSDLLRAIAGTVLIIASLGSGTSALAQGLDCQCVLPLNAFPSTGPIGQLTEASGNVMLTGPAGPAPAMSGASLRVGDQITVGPQSSASFLVGNCALRLSAQTEMNLVPFNGNLCVAVAETGFQSTAGTGNLTPLLVMGTLPVAAAVAVSFNRGDRTPVSP